MMGRFRAQCEYVVWGSSGPMPQLTEVGVLPGFFLGRDNPQGRDHMASKPISVMREIVRIVPPGGLVLDPFMGTGSTGVAAIQEGRRFLGIELLPDNIERASNHLSGPLFAQDATQEAQA
jgi:site-specific DNA-methyltransferase (adenine-specific)